MAAWGLVYRMTKDHDGDFEAALNKVREFARDMMESEELKIQGSDNSFTVTVPILRDWNRESIVKEVERQVSERLE